MPSDELKEGVCKFYSLVYYSLVYNLCEFNLNKDDISQNFLIKTGFYITISIYLFYVL